MADYENNYKYIAEAWINNEEEEAYKVAFMTSLLKQWQHHGHGFCADKLDGYHAEYFINEIERVDSTSLKEFWIGPTRFDNTVEKYNIDISSINLYPYVTSNVSDEDMANALRVMPWKREGATRLGNGPFTETNPSLIDILTELYLELDSKKVNKTEYNAFVAEQRTLNDQYAYLLDINKWITPDGINATTVNGLRFYVKTPAQYEQVPLEVKKNIHNIFIIKDPEDFPEGMTEYDENPDVALFDRGYEFKVDYATTSDGQGNTTTDLWLMYRLGQGEWKLIVKTAEFLDSNAIESIIEEIQQNLTIDTKKLYQALQEPLPTGVKLNSTTAPNYPLLSYIKSNYAYNGVFTRYEYVPPNERLGELFGTVQQVTGENNTTRLNRVVDEENGYKYINLDGLLSYVSSGSEKIGGYATAMSHKIKELEELIRSNKTSIEANASDIATNSNKINVNKIAIVGQNSSLSDNKIKQLNLNDRISELESKMSSVIGAEEYEAYTAGQANSMLRKVSFDYLKPYMIWMDGISRLSTNHQNNQHYRSYIMYYPFLSLAYLYISFEHQYIAETDRFKYVPLRSKMNNNSFNATLYPEFRSLPGKVGDIYDWYLDNVIDPKPGIEYNPDNKLSNYTIGKNFKNTTSAQNWKNNMTWGPFIPPRLQPMTTVTRANSTNYQSTEKTTVVGPHSSVKVYPQDTPMIKYNTNGKIEVLFTGDYDRQLYLYGGVYYLIKPQGEYTGFGLPDAWDLPDVVDLANKDYFRNVDTILRGQDEHDIGSG